MNHSLERPVAETIVMLLRIIVANPPHSGVSINVVPDEDAGRRCTRFTAEHNPLRKATIIEPLFDEVPFNGVCVILTDGLNVNSTNRYAGADIANIAADIFKYLAMPA